MMIVIIVATQVRNASQTLSPCNTPIRLSTPDCLNAANLVLMILRKRGNSVKLTGERQFFTGEVNNVSASCCGDLPRLAHATSAPEPETTLAASTPRKPH